MGRKVSLLDMGGFSHLKLIKSFIVWGTITGLVIGYYGIPVLIPGYANNWHNWVWNQPDGFYVVSILFFGTLGCSVGVFLHLWIRKRLDRRAMTWMTGVFSVALLVGTIGVYRHHAYNESIKWTQINLGFVRTMAASEANLSVSTANRDRSIGAQLIQAGSDMGTGDNFGALRGQQLGHVASALSEAGYYMVTQQDEEKFRESIKFVNQAGAIIKAAIGNQSYSQKTKHFHEILTKINKEIPPDFDKTWEAN